MRLTFVVVGAAILRASTAWAPTVSTTPRAFSVLETDALDAGVSRRRFLGGLAAGSVAAMPTLEVSARGRGTQPAMFQRYSPRIIAFGEYLKSELPAKIEAGDWTALKGDVAADISKKKGKVGPIYAGASAMNLWASTYSETAITPVQKELDTQVAVLTDLRAQLETLALKGTGEGLKKTGGFFGIGAKPEPPPSPATLKKEAMTALSMAKVAYNKYVEVNNKYAPFEIKPLPSI